MKCPTPITIRDPRTKKLDANTKIMTEVPCGKCGACQHNRRCDWSFRLIQEAKYSKNMHFVTLTYDDANLPVTEDGEITLRKKDLQDFMKRLRHYQSKHSDEKIRYYAVGEYGTQTGRPHYHLLLFNLEDTIYIHLSWQNGIVDIGNVEAGSIHYVTKYHVNPDRNSNIDIEPEFALMSRRPGIGYKYVEKNGKWNKENLYNYVINNGFKQRIPRFYRDKIFDEYEKYLIKNELNEKIDSSLVERLENYEKNSYENPYEQLRKDDVNSSENIYRHKNSKKSLF